MSTRLDRNELERLRDAKRSRTFFRLESSQVVEHEFRGHRSSYAFVQFECNPADDLSFEARAFWPPTVLNDYRTQLELAVAEGVADVLLDGLYQHSGCTVALVAVRYDEIGSTESAFMRAAKSAMQNLLAAKWTPVGRTETMEGKPDYSGMTVNERLFSAGLMADWDGAAQSRNRKRMVELLTKVDLEDEADQIVDTILSNPQRYGF